MPIFEFRCTDCGESFEQLIRSQEAAACPKCGHKHVEKLMSAPSMSIRSNGGLPLASSCPPSNAPPCGPGCCRLN